MLYLSEDKDSSAHSAFGLTKSKGLTEEFLLFSIISLILSNLFVILFLTCYDIQFYHKIKLVPSLQVKELVKVVLEQVVLEQVVLERIQQGSS
jgi:hypothetical protein